MARILIIEDTIENMYLTTYLLTNAGHEIIQATTGEEGVEKALSEHPDIILMDILLPGIDGYEATMRIREAETDKPIPVVALTSYAMVGDREKALSLGCTGYIEKPIDPETFVKKIEEFLKSEE
ncbi:MAG: response regulator [Methanomicrobiaceae archaeon]|nr:response regulator [Methanomicrobiaceae archaeon]